MSVLLPALGAALILGTLREVSHTLFHPTGEVLRAYRRRQGLGEEAQAAT